MYLPESTPYRHVRTVSWVFIAVNAILLFSLPLLPFIDLPNHLAEAAIYKYYEEPGNQFANYYRPVPWYYPNTFHTVFCSLFPSVELGNKVFTVLYVLILQLSLFLVIRQLKGNPWYGLLGILFTYNYNLTFGFVGYAISIPTVILLFYLILRDIEKDTVLLKIGIAVMFILIYLMHAQTALFALVLYGLVMLYTYRKSFQKLLLRTILVPLPLVLLIFVWWFTRGSEKEGSTAEYLIDYYTHNYLPEFIYRIKLIVFDNYRLAEGTTGVVIAALLFLTVIIPLFYFQPFKNQTFRKLFDESTYPLMLFISALACYLVLPDELPGQAPLYERFCSIVNLSFVILVSVWLKNVFSSKLRIYALGVCFVYFVLWFEYLIAFNNENRYFRPEFFERAEANGRLAGLIYDNKFRRANVYIHFQNYYLVWKHGIAASKIIDYRFGVVRRVASEDVVPFYHEYIGDQYRQTPEYNSLEYLLVKGNAPVKKDLNLSCFTLINEKDGWKLYKNKRTISLSKY